MKTILVFFTLICSGIAYGDLPENDLYLQDNDFMFNNSLTEDEFNDTIDEVSKIYAPIVENMGATLTINGDWDDSTVNAWTKTDGKEWIIQMFGGLARRKEITKDGFKMVICHEIAHHIGGYPNQDWAAIEGQADYVTTFVCAKKVFADTTVSINNYKWCDFYGTEKEKNVCNRSLDASQSLADLLASLSYGKKPDFETPDKTEVRKTSTYHPKAQCRLDTFLAGAVCDKKWDDKVIPKNAKATCDNRPKCWFYK